MNAQVWQQVHSFVRSRNFVLVIAGLVGCLAFLMLVGFFLFSWFATNEDAATTIGDRSISAAGIWFGGNDDFASLDLENLLFENKTGLGKVRAIDRILLIIPLGAITLMVLAVMIILGKLPLDQGLINLVLVALLLFIFPYLWQSLSTSQWRDYLESENVESLEDSLDQFSQLYSTGEQKFLGFLMVLVATIGLGLYVADQYQLLDKLAVAQTPRETTSGLPPEEEEYLGPPDED